ncbi:MAG: hypothetical protein Q8O44_01165 [Syntrophales bacterium]|nr:hypothetical protein [Syntrophales bacterium]
MEEHYQILAYIDDLEEARRLAQESNLSSKLIKMIDSVRGDLVELEPILTSEKDYQRLAEVVEEPIEDLIGSCRKGEEASCGKKAETLQSQVYEMKNSLGLEKAKALINGNGFTLIGTADKKGKVDIAFCGSATIIDEKHVAVAWLLLSRTAENLEANKHATIIGSRISEESPMDTEVARIYCTLAKEEDTGPIFEMMREAIEKEAGKTVADMMRKVYLFKIEEIRISAPSSI